MSRDDSSLYTGTTSASMLSPVQQDLNKKKQEEAIVRDFERKQLAPFAQIVTDIFNEEIDEIRLIDYGNLDESLSAQEFKDQMIINKRAMEVIKKVQQRINQKLRTN